MTVTTELVLIVGATAVVCFGGGLYLGYKITIWMIFDPDRIVPAMKTPQPLERPNTVPTPPPEPDPTTLIPVRGKRTLWDPPGS